MPKYGDKTAKKLDDYRQNYTIPAETTRTELAGVHSGKSLPETCPTHHTKYK